MPVQRERFLVVDRIFPGGRDPTMEKCRSPVLPRLQREQRCGVSAQGRQYCIASLCNLAPDLGWGLQSTLSARPKPERLRTWPPQSIFKGPGCNFSPTTVRRADSTVRNPDLFTATDTRREPRCTTYMARICIRGCLDTWCHCYAQYDRRIENAAPRS